SRSNGSGSALRVIPSALLMNAGSTLACVAAYVAGAATRPSSNTYHEPAEAGPPMTSSDFVAPEGINFRSATMDVATLSRTLCEVASFPQALDPYASLRRFDDWREHDGLLFARGSLDFPSLFRLIGTPKALLEATPDDDEVRVGVAPADDS